MREGGTGNCGSVVTMYVPAGNRRQWPVDRQPYRASAPLHDLRELDAEAETAGQPWAGDIIP